LKLARAICVWLIASLTCLVVAQWHQVVTPHAPGAGHRMYMTYDASRDRHVLYGGTGSAGETWEFDGADWLLKVPSNGIHPPALYAAPVVYDSTRKRVVLFGGFGAQPVGETWIWDGSNWTRLPVTGPSPRFGALMAYDSGRDRIVLFGGCTSESSSLNDTWEFNGTTWTQVTPASPLPSARGGGQMVYDPLRKRCLISCGGPFNGPFLDDSWEWDGSQWSRVLDGTSPARYWPQMAHDTISHRTFLYGGAYPQGQGSTYPKDFWVFDGTQWTSFNTAAPFEGREEAGFDFDSKRKAIVLFGGADSTNDTWLWVSPVVRPVAISLDKTNLNPAETATATLTLSNTAANDVARITASSLDITFPSAVVIPAGQNTVQFTLRALSVTAQTQVTLYATLNDITTSVNLSVNPPSPQLMSLTISPSVLTGGNTATGTVNLTTAADNASADVSLSSGGSSVIAIPASLRVPQGNKSASFSITTYGTSYKHSALITATYKAVTRSTYITCTPAALSGLSLPSSVLAGDSTTGLVNLNGRSGAALTVTLSSNNAAVTVPPSVSIPANSTHSLPFKIQTDLVSVSSAVTISATLNSVTRSGTLAVQYASFNIAADSPIAVSGHATTGTITLANAAPVGGVSLSLSDPDAFIDAPASVTVPQGASTASFTVKVYGVNANTLAVVSATASGLTRSCKFTVTPAPLLRVSLAANSVRGGSSTSGRAFLDGLNGTKVETVTLSCNNANVTLPATATIPANGDDTFLFTVQTASVATSQSATIFASLNGVTKTTVLTINP
jgi:hypothetical protein